MSDHQGSSMLVGFALGAVVGAGLALLLAPATGSDTRQRIKEKAQELGGKAKELGESAHGKFEEVGQTVREGARELTHAVKEGRDAFQKMADEAVTPARRA